MKVERSAIRTGWGAYIPLPILLNVGQKVPLRYIYAIADKIYGFKWITPKGRIHVDTYPYHYSKDEIIVETNKYYIRVTPQKFTVIDRFSNRIVFKTSLDEVEFKMIMALVKLNEVLRKV